MMKDDSEESAVGAIAGGPAADRQVLFQNRFTRRPSPTHGALIVLRIPSWTAFSSS